MVLVELGNASIAFASLLIVVDGAALLAAIILAYKSRYLKDEFMKSKWIGVACASWIQAILIGVPIVLLTRTQPVAQVAHIHLVVPTIHLIVAIHQPYRLFYSEQYFTSTALSFLVCSSMLSLLFSFVPKMKMAAKPPEVPRSSYQPTNNTYLTSAYNSQLPTVVHEHKNSSECEPDKDMILVKKMYWRRKMNKSSSLNSSSVS
jgi:hypothetical protein